MRPSEFFGSGSHHGNGQDHGATSGLDAPPFVIFSLPRSRSKWLSAFLTYNDWLCSHDEVMHFRSLDDARSWLSQSATGSCETAAAPFWRLLQHYRPDARIVTVRRPVEEVYRSLTNRFPIEPERAKTFLRRLDSKLDQIEARTDAVRFEYADLEQEEVCAALFEYVLPYDHDPVWWRAMAGLNLQVNLFHVYRYMQAHMPQLERLMQQAKHRTATLFARPVELEGMTLQVEPWDQFYTDATPLFREHLTQTEQNPEDYVAKNVPLFKLMDDLGACQVMTARCNGRMFGYLVTLICPSFDAESRLIGYHSIFFADASFKNLGMKLQRAAVSALRERGINEVQMRAGHRGGGPRLGTFYKRLGAEPFGQLYRLELGE